MTLTVAKKPIIDKMMRMIETTTPKFHGTAFSFSSKSGESFVYVSTVMGRVSVDGMTLDYTPQEYQEIMQFIFNTHFPNADYSQL